MAGAGFVEHIAQYRAFTRETFAGRLSGQYLNACFEVMAPKHHDAFVADIDAALDRFARHDGTFDQTFVRLDLLIDVAA